MDSNRIKKILILVTILAVPGFLYYLLQEKGKNRYKPLAIYGPKKVAATFHSVRGKQIPDTIYHILPDFNLINQEGKTITWDDYKDKIVLVNLFYTQGQNEGATLVNKALMGLAKTFAKNPMIHFVGLSIDPTTDQPALLQQYQKEKLLNAPKLDLLTGDTTALNTMIKNGLLLDAIKTIDNGQAKFTFSNLFVLLDSKHRIRGYYEATNQEALSKLEDEIKVLVAEELRNTKDGR